MTGLQKFIHRIDSISEWSGRISAWISLPLVVFMAYDVIMRYLFQAPTKWAYEMTWMQYGALFMLGGAYGLKYKLHVRVDIIYVRWSRRTRAMRARRRRCRVEEQLMSLASAPRIPSARSGQNGYGSARYLKLRNRTSPEPAAYNAGRRLRKSYATL